MNEEMFAPVLPLVSYDNFDKEVLEGHIHRLDKPLAIYYFGQKTDQQFQDIVNKTSSGAVTLNDVMMQVLATECGFGGVGGSGMGRYGGFIGFQNFSNPKNVVELAVKNNAMIKSICPPWTESKQNMVNNMFKFLFLRQNATFYFVLKLVALALFYKVMFGTLGDSSLR